MKRFEKDFIKLMRVLRQYYIENPKEWGGILEQLNAECEGFV